MSRRSMPMNKRPAINPSCSSASRLHPARARSASSAAAERYLCRAIRMPTSSSKSGSRLKVASQTQRAITFCSWPGHVNRWTNELLRRIAEGQIDPSFVITHTVDLDEGPEMYKVFRDKQDSCCIKVV